jgi:hypothetical protein
MINKKAIIFFILSCTMCACRSGNVHTVVPFFDDHGKHIGDSVFAEGGLKKIIVRDSTYQLDSIVFDYFRESKGGLKSKYTYRDGKQVFQNIDYFENGRVKAYRFIDQLHKENIYERLYNDKGFLLKINGTPFFQGVVNNMNIESLSVPLGVPVIYKIYFPNPPDCESNVMVKYDDGTIHDFLSKDPYIEFVKSDLIDMDSVGVYRTNFILQLEEKQIDTSFTFERPLIFKVVSRQKDKT